MTTSYRTLPSTNAALVGTLRDWSLVDVIQLIDLGKKTGAVIIRGHQATRPVEGQITFVEGTIHHARNGERAGAEALFDLFGTTEGTFRFTPVEDLPPRNVYLSNEHAIMEGLTRQERRHAAAPDNADDVRVRLVAVPRTSASSIVLTPDQWRLITHIQGETPLSVIAANLSTTPARIRERLADLIERDLVAERTRPSLSAD